MAIVTCAINTNDENLIQQFKNRMSSARIQVSALKAADSHISGCNGTTTFTERKRAQSLKSCFWMEKKQIAG